MWLGAPSGPGRSGTGRDKTLQPKQKTRPIRGLPQRATSCVPQKMWQLGSHVTRLATVYVAPYATGRPSFGIHPGITSGGTDGSHEARALLQKGGSSSDSDGEREREPAVLAASSDGRCKTSLRRRLLLVPLGDVRLRDSPRRLCLRRLRPTGGRKEPCAFTWFVASWARTLLWQETARRFATRWDIVFRSIQRRSLGLENRPFDGIHAIGIDNLS